ncbi:MULTISPECIES: hypothetical protein [unclassified Bradyrhizobium]|uniref:hypothetical protein n=1 Tax=unclassified Bradyrhizobium TaxID=2631580 RepID=UPI00247AAD68|nr:MULTISPECIES: hypothetical protein [unclassified Bradyrhizobium]WGR69526.1 hypothetical protein MTX24_29465 [Bradyrhizobium sp. ISRA426]WGR81582.1 hypothetical protein MTX21_14575 [Bradyrhizobium sp. ISRA430]WGR84766.1 hypothetical protein MTX25_29140 [Bradyrhizobium sp. ISRA432]
MFSNASFVLILAAAAFATAGTASAQTAAARHVSPQKTIGTAKPEAPSIFDLNALSAKRGFALRQDLFDRNNPTNIRSDWPGPPAQPGQF